MNKKEPSEKRSPKGFSISGRSSDQITAKAEKLQISRSEVVQRLIDQFLDKL